MDFNGLELVAKIALFFPPFLFALCFHEFAHGWAAKKFGDNTAEYMGRLTLNPFPHMDFLGTLILPVVGVAAGGMVFGWAKPVPVNPRNLSQPKQQMFWIAFAGPLSNVLLGFIGGLALAVAKYTYQPGDSAVFVEMLNYFIIINAMLAVFNMIPLHPLDGGKVFARFLPEDLNQKLESTQQYTTFILLAFLILGGFQILAIPIFALANVFDKVGLILMGFVF